MCRDSSSFVVKVLPHVWQVNFCGDGLLSGGGDGGVVGSGGGMGGGAWVMPSAGSSGFFGYG
jgi:hypothetical protein